MTQPTALSADALPADLFDEFAGVYAGYRTNLGDMIGRVVADWKALNAEASPRPGIRAPIEPVVSLVHRIAGSAGTFGYPSVSDAAAPLEMLLRELAEESTGSDSALYGRVDRLVDYLDAVWQRDRDQQVSPLAALTAGLSAPARRAATGDDRHAIVLVDDDDGLATGLAHQIEQFGYEVRTFTTIAEAEAATAVTRPAAAVLDLSFPEGELAGAGLALRFGSDIPTIVMTSRTDFAARLAVVRAGCAAFLVKPVEVHDLIGWLDDLTGRRAEQVFRVLIVDDDLMLAETYALALKSAGMRPTVLAEPRRILEALAEVQPDLILMDVYMPDHTGIELAGVVRQHRQYLGTPIVFLSVEGDLSRQLAALQPGGDDFLTKPIRPDHLVKAVMQRAERARKLRLVMETDSLTGLVNHARIKARLAEEMVRAARRGTPLSFALIDLDFFKKVNDQHGHLAGDRVLKALAYLLARRLRRSDIIGRYGGEEFAVILTDTDTGAAAGVLDDVRNAFSQVRHGEPGQPFTVTLSIGVAGFAGHIHADTLVAEADAALYRAKAEGRNRVDVA